MFSYSFISISEYKKHNLPLEDYVKLAHTSSWCVLNSKINELHKWISTHAASEVVRIPIFAYDTISTDPSVALASAFQLGTELLLSNSLNIKNPKIHLSIGDSVDVVKSSTEFLRFYLGIAIA